MRIALALIATAFTLVVLPLTAQATSTCSDCPDLVDETTDLGGTVTVTPRVSSPRANRQDLIDSGGMMAYGALSPRERRQDLIDRRRMIVTSALSGPDGRNGEGPIDMGGDGGPSGGGDGGVVPEPATGLMTALGLLGIAVGRRRRA